MPWADVMYGCDERWWDSKAGAMDFAGEKFSTHDKASTSNNKESAAEKYGLTLVKGSPGDGFSLDPAIIHYGDNSGFQGLNLAILFGATFIVLVGFDMRFVDGKSHFFGHHPKGLYQREEYESFAKKFVAPPDGVTIINATPGSALKAYPIMGLDEVLENC
jgi:hypothetical protein